MAIGRVNTGGGGSGGTLTVTGIAGHTVTATKDGKTYARTFNSGGVAVFKGLSTGTWTLTMTGDGQTATRTVDVNADYAVTITYFSATINITYPATSTCVVTNSSGQTVASDNNTGSSTKTWTATVNATGTYTVTATATDGSGKSKSQSVSITTDGQSKSVTLSYEFKIFTSGVGYESGIKVTNVYEGGLTVTSERIQATDGKWFIGPIDMTNYSVLNVDMYKTSGPYGDSDTEISVRVGNYDGNSVASKTFQSKNYSRNVYTLDISSVTTGCGIRFGNCYNTYIYNIWLS